LTSLGTGVQAMMQVGSIVLFFYMKFRRPKKKNICLNSRVDMKDVAWRNPSRKFSVKQTNGSNTPVRLSEGCLCWWVHRSYQSSYGNLAQADSMCRSFHQIAQNYVGVVPHGLSTNFSSAARRMLA
jgi:hypothetical protein